MKNTSAYTPAPLQDGEFLIKILDVHQNENAVFVFYDIAVGDSVGWATVNSPDGKNWPLIQRIDLRFGKHVLDYLLKHTNSDTIYDLPGSVVCVNIEVGKYINIRGFYPAERYQITPDDIHIGTGSWAAGSKVRERARLLASLSNLPVLQCDTHERHSPMVDWCPNNGIVLLPSPFPVGDYATADHDVIVDRKENIEEVIANMFVSSRARSYDMAAREASALGRKLIYVIDVDPSDQIGCKNDLKGRNWNILNGMSVTGDDLFRKLDCYEHRHSNASFVFVPHDNLCETIYGLVSGQIK